MLRFMVSIHTTIVHLQQSTKQHTGQLKKLRNNIEQNSNNDDDDDDDHTESTTHGITPNGVDAKQNTLIL